LQIEGLALRAYPSVANLQGFPGIQRVPVQFAILVSDPKNRTFFSQTGIPNPKPQLFQEQANPMKAFGKTAVFPNRCPPLNVSRGRMF
jgi:hypothetical protein